MALGRGKSVVQAPFTGSVLAPYGKLVLLGRHRAVLRGLFHARDLVVGFGAKVELRVPEALRGVPACRALTADELAKAQGAGLAPLLYPVTGREILQTWPIPFGDQWQIGLRYDSGIGRTGTASRFRVLSLFDGQVRGGNTFVLRQ